MAIVVAIAILVYLVIGPLVMLLFTSFKQTVNALPFENGVPYTFDNYTHLLLDPGTWRVLLTTAVFVVGSLAIGMAIAIPIAWLVERTNFPLRNVVFVLIVGSSGIPTVISAISWALLLNPSNGMVNVWIRGLLGLGGQGPLNVYTVVGLFLVQGISIVPLSILLIGASFKSMDASLEEAAATSGAPFRAIVRRVTLPVLAPPSSARWCTSSWSWWSRSTFR